jgi:hypothetical protein
VTRLWGRTAAIAAAVFALLAPAAAAHGSPTGEPDLGRGGHVRFAPIAHAANVTFGGGSVMHTQRVHVIYWAPAGSSLGFDPGYEDQINTFLARVAAASHSTSNVFGLMGQYGNLGGPAAYDMTFAGPVLDTDPLPTDPSSKCTEPLAPPLGVGPPGWTACVTDAAIEAELGHVLRADGLPSGLKDMYVLVMPNGFGSCFDGGPDNCALGGDRNQGYCGYHSSSGNPGILYAVVPYNAVTGHCQSDNPRPNASTTDPTISTIAHEIAEIATDPVNDGWSDGGGNEIADLCIMNYGPNLGGSSGGNAYDEEIGGGHYYIQELWSNSSHACEPAPKPDSLTISGPSRAAGDRALAFAAQAADPEGRVLGYSWAFGDGNFSAQQQPTHTFLSVKTFTVSLRITDSWGNWTYATRAVTVRRPRPPVATVSGTRVRGRRATVWFSSDAASARFSCRVDHRAWVGCHSPYVAIGLAAGGHRISIRARDTFRQLGPPYVYAFTVA